MASPSLIDSLLQTALYDQGGESVEGGFVDRWVTNASVASEELAGIFGERGFLPADAERIRAELVQATARPREVATLLFELKPYLAPLAEELLRHPDPHVRSLLVRSVVGVLPGETWLPLLGDPDPDVRRAAVEVVGSNWGSVKEANAYLLRALEDPDPEVRAAAGQGVQLTREPPTGAILARAITREPDPHARGALLLALAEKVRRAGIHVAGATLLQGVGEETLALLLEELGHPSPEVRKAIVEAVGRFHGADVARRLLQRLQVEPDRDVRLALVQFQGFQQIAPESRPLLFELLAHDPDPVIRYRVAFLLEFFGPEAEGPLLQALEGPTQRAAAFSLGKVGGLRSLPALVHAWNHPNTPHWLWDREMESILTDVVIRAAYADPAPPVAEVSDDVRRLLESLAPSGWVEREFKEEYDALLLHGTQIYAWGLKPDGEILCMDHESFRHETEPEASPLTRFAVWVAGARRYPALRNGIPQPPKSARPCPRCRATGAEPGEGLTCLSCSGLGWFSRG